MAYQIRTRDPLLDAKIQEAIHRRGKELLGFGLIALAVLFGAILWSYSPEDSSWQSATSAPIQNYLGAFGAAIASQFTLTIGLAAWTIPLLLATWGVRFILHIGDDLMLSRAIAFPVFIAVTAIFLACHVPSASWQHNGLGLGGLSGDAALGVLLDLMPFSTGASLIMITLLFAAFVVLSGLFTLGFVYAEVSLIARHAIVAIILTYDSIASMLGFAVRHGAGGAFAAGSRLQARREKRAEKMAILQEEAEETVIEQEQPAPKKPLFSLPKLRRVTEPETEDTPDTPEEPPTADTFGLLPEEDRVKARINDAIKSKVLRARTMRIRQHPQEPVVTDNLFRDTPDVDENAAPALGGVHRDLVADDLRADEVAESIMPAFASIRRAAPVSPRPPAEAESVVKPRVQKTVKQSSKAIAEAQPSLFVDREETAYETPPLSLLTSPDTIVRHHLSDEALEENARMLENVLDDYGVKGDIVSVRPGPVVTMYELEPAPGLKASRVIGLADDIARSMSALSARVSTVPGRSVIGIELPNENRETVLLREILASADYGDGLQNLPLALGKDIGGQSIVADLGKMPHLLIAGTTGSGKSVAINTMILSLLYKLSPEECRMIMIDPKMLELSVYDGIPHLLSPVVTDPKKAVVALKWAVGEMEDRYRKMSKMGVRNIGGYNARVATALNNGEDFERTVQTGFDDETGDPVFETETFKPEKLPYIVIIVDEMADLMMVAGKEIEACIQRLAQMARASGIHMIMATQRPSVDVITGTIKANFPTRISFQVTSKIDSRTILGEMGAEQLLGMGDMLYMAGGGKITRVHAPFASDEEVEEVVNALKAYGPPTYVSGVVEEESSEKSNSIDLVLGLGGNTTGEDALYDQAVAIVVRDRKCSTSYIQRKLSIGYNKAAKLVEKMEEEGVVSQANHVGKREILVPEQ
jgi:S-DNA-T family DNA segregation ATPase FtsK/SpoIIIE